MMNRLPERNKRYKHKEHGEEIQVYDVTHQYKEFPIIFCHSFDQKNTFTIRSVDFFEVFEEISGAQKTEEVQVIVDIAKEGTEKRVFWCKMCKKQISPDLVKGGETDFHSEDCYERAKLFPPKVNGVERAFKALKEEVEKVDKFLLDSLSIPTKKKDLARYDLELQMLHLAASNLVKAFNIHKNMKVHEIKCDQTYFESLLKGEKNFELRFNDRNYQVGDGLILKKNGTNKKAFASIDYILKDFAGLQDNYVILNLKNIQELMI